MVQIIMKAVGHEWEDLYAVCEIDRRLAEIILERKKSFEGLLQKEVGLSDFTFWDNNIRIFSWLDEMEELLEKVEEDEMVILENKHPVSDNQFEKIECTQMIITDSEIFWRTILKKVNVEIETSGLSYDMIEKIYREGR